MTDAALTALIGSGPLAILLAFALTVVWLENRRLRVYYEGDPESPDKTPGKIAQIEAAGRVREDGIRAAADLQLAREREENKALWREISDTLKEFSGEVG